MNLHKQFNSSSLTVGENHQSASSFLCAGLQVTMCDQYASRFTRAFSCAYAYACVVRVNQPL